MRSSRSLSLLAIKLADLSSTITCEFPFLSERETGLKICHEERNVSAVTRGEVSISLTPSIDLLCSARVSRRRLRSRRLSDGCSCPHLAAACSPPPPPPPRPRGLGLCRGRPPGPPRLRAAQEARGPRRDWGGLRRDGVEDRVPWAVGVVPVVPQRRARRHVLRIRRGLAPPPPDLLLRGPQFLMIRFFLPFQSLSTTPAFLHFCTAPQTLKPFVVVELQRPEMPGRPSDPGAEAIVPISPESRQPVVLALRHGVAAPVFRVYISWSRGSLLHVACLRQPSPEPDGAGDDDEEGGKVVEVRLGAGEGGISESQMRRIAYGSVPPFVELQSWKNSLAALSMMSSSSFRTEKWQHILEYSRKINELLKTHQIPPDNVIEDPRIIVKPLKEPTSLRAAWELMEIFFVDKQSLSWLPERLVDWLEDYDSLVTGTDLTVYSKLVAMQKKLVDFQVIEDNPDYWEAMSSALAVGWLDTVAKLLRLHGSYQLDQLDDRETENGLVEAVAVLILTMPRLCPDLSSEKTGQCYDTKPDFIKAWEKWRGQVSKLERSAYWVQCSHHQTREGLHKLLKILLGNISNLTSATCHWMELLISHLLYTRPFIMGLEGLNNLAQKCQQLKPTAEYNGLMSLLMGILQESPEAVLAECSRTYGPWMVAHGTELLAAGSDYADIQLHEERYNLGSISIEELHWLVYAQVLSSHPLTWQIASTYLAQCPKQGLGLLEFLLYKQPLQHHQGTFKNLDLCHSYDLDNISASIMKIAGMHHWKHGRKGFGIYWLQLARDEVRLNRIAQQLFEFIGRSLSDDSFQQWEGLIELLGTRIGSSGGLEFLHKYRDLKRLLKQVEDGRAVNAARLAAESLVQLMKSPSTPQQFWLPLLYDSVNLLNWKAQPLLRVSETNLLLNKLQDLSMAKMCPGFVDSKLPSHALSSVRLALAKNLGRAILEEC